MRRSGHGNNGATYGDHHRYSVHERMLDRYGIRYICEHPEILFHESDVPKTGLAGQDCRNSAYAGRHYASMTYMENIEALPSDDADDLLRRLSEAYRILRQIFSTPYCPATDDGKTQ